MIELNLNCDLGENSKIIECKNDKKLLKVVNTANIACGYHAGNKLIMMETIKNAKINNVSIGAHPGFKDKRNFGRKRINLTQNEIYKLILDQLIIISKIADTFNFPITHVKPHGALNNIACEDLNTAITIGKAINYFQRDLIYMILPLTKMHKAANKLNMKYACEIFADRNYNDKGLLIDRSNPQSLIEDVNESINNILFMLDNKCIKTISGKILKTDIDTICIHGDNLKAIEISKKLKIALINNNIKLLPLNKLSKFN